MQIGSVKYSKKEEAIFFKSFLLGLMLGLPPGIILSYILGFPAIPKQFPNDFQSWFIFLSLWLAELASLWFVATVTLYFIYYKREKMFNSRLDIFKIFLSILIFFPILFLYVIVVMSAIFVPLYSAASWLSPIRKYWLGAVLFLPFLFLYMLIFLPDQRPRKIIARLWLILNGKASIPKLNVRSLVVSLLILLWLVLVFLPLPDVPAFNLILITSGLLIVAYLAKQRYQIKK